MLTFKEALGLLAIVTAYGITGRMDYEDALLLEQARQHDGVDCVLQLSAGDGPPEVGPPDPTQGTRPIEGTRLDEPCASSVRLTQH